MDHILTEDGGTVREGDRVFNYYDGWWGTLGPIDSDGWADVTRDDGRRAYLNGERMSTYDPKGSTDPKAATDRFSETLTLTVPADCWEANGKHRLTGPMLFLNGIGMHVAAWEVTVDEFGTQQLTDVAVADYLIYVHDAVAASGPFQTQTINGRDYVVVITPHCQ